MQRGKVHVQQPASRINTRVLRGSRQGTFMQWCYVNSICLSWLNGIAC